MQNFLLDLDSPSRNQRVVSNGSTGLLPRAKSPIESRTRRVQPPLSAQEVFALPIRSSLWESLAAHGVHPSLAIKILKFNKVGISEVTLDGSTQLLIPTEYQNTIKSLGNGF